MGYGIKTRLQNKARAEGFYGFMREAAYIASSMLFRPVNTLMIKAFRHLPLQENVMVFESEGDFTDNARTFYEYLIAHGYNKKYKIIWFVHKPKDYPKTENVLFVNRFHAGLTLKADYYSGVAKTFFFSHPYWLKDWRKEQLVIHVNHGVAPLKLQLPPKDYRIFDYILGCSPYGQYILGRGYACKESEVLTLGMPRIDLLYKHKNCCRLLWDDYDDQRLILSMQTFRQSGKWNDSSRPDPFALNIVRTKKELLMLDKYLQANNSILAIKIHHLQDMSFLKLVKLKNIRYLTDSDLAAKKLQVNELLENADVLLTDYSSVFYEYLLKDRPIGFLIGDIAEYSRGFMYEDPLKEMPGRKIKSLNELTSFISDCSAGRDEWIEERKKMRDRMFTHQDGNNCRRLIDWLEQH